MEVEIKLVCKNLGRLRKKLLERGAVLVKTKRQIDTYYDHPSKVLVKGGEYLRIRKAGNKKTIAHHINLDDGVNDECEIEMVAEAEVEKLLKRLAFPKLGVIDKKRGHYQLGDFNICLDEVRRIGNFVEIELTVQRGNEREALARCWQLASAAG